MIKVYFSTLILCTLLIGYANAQSAGEPAIAATGEQQVQAPYFYAYPNPNMNIVVLRWQILSESSTDHFVLERATDNVHFAPLHELVARGGSAGGPAYEDEDNSVAGQVNYYRLKIVGKDGNAFYSPVARVDMTDRTAMVLKPTLLHLGTTLRLNTYSPQPLTINFFNESGAMTGTFMVNGSSFDINTSNWGKGLYVYRISDARHPLIDAGKVIIL